MKREKNQKLTEEQIFYSAANNCAVVDKDAGLEVLDALDVLHRQAGVPRTARRATRDRIVMELQAATPPEQAKIIGRLKNLTAWIKTIK